MKIIYGAAAADSGQIICGGTAIANHSLTDARRLGIEMVYQYFALFESITVVENIALSMPGRMNLKALSARIRDVSDRYSLPIDPSRLILELPVGERQRVEFVRCLLRDPKLLILDEPTSVLTPQAVQTLRQLAQDGCSILSISHKLDDVRDLCHSATVLRGGKVTGAVDPRTATSAQLARMRVGKDLPEVLIPPTTLSHAPLLQIINLSLAPESPLGTRLKSTSLDAYAGEIVGIAGVSVNGRPNWRRQSAANAFRTQPRISCLRVARSAIVTAHRKGMVKNGTVQRGAAAIIVAFIGRLNAFGIVLGGLLMSLLYLGGEEVQLSMGLPASVTLIFQGLLLFFLLASNFLIGFRIHKRTKAS